MPVIINATGLAVIALITGLVGLAFLRKNKKTARILLIIAGFLLIISCLHLVYFLFSFR